MVCVEPRSTWSHCGSLKALPQRVVVFPSTALPASNPAASTEDAVAGLLSARFAEPDWVGVTVGGTGVLVLVGVFVGGAVLVGVSDGPIVGVGPLPTGSSANLMGVSLLSFTVLTVSQSSFRMPPVSPEFGFHDQNVQPLALEPVPR